MKILFTVCLGMSFTILYGQTGKETNIYDKISNQLCNCMKSATITDSTRRKEHCYELVLNENYDELYSYGVDTLKNKDFKKYYDLYLKRFKNTNSKSHYESEKKSVKDDSFLGSFIKQEKIPECYSITLRSSEHSVTRTFVSAEPINEKELKRFVSGEDNVIVSYGTISQNGKEKYVVKSIVYLGKEKK